MRLGLLAGLALAARLGAGEPRLLPGEGLAVAEAEGPVRVWGEAGRETPMGSLAKLVWLARSGPDWAARAVTFRCDGHWDGLPCWNREGHGPVDLAAAAQASCNLAFLAWARADLARAEARQGPSAARSALAADFRPFLGPREPPAGPLGPAWIGTGTLLRTSPAAFAAWLAAQGGLRSQAAGLLADAGGGWVKTGTAAAVTDPQRTWAWAAGVREGRILVLRLPEGRGKAEGLARFRAVADALAAGDPPPVFAGDPDGEARLRAPLAAAAEGTRAWGPWPAGTWTVQLHTRPGAFEAATGAPPQRAALWVGATLHLRPLAQLQRRDLGALLRHELVHRRLAGAGLRPWEEEARCLAAETRAAPPAVWPAPPEGADQAALDQALDRGTTRAQAWAYAYLRAWLAGMPPPSHRSAIPPEAPGWREDRPEPRVTVVWPVDRFPRDLTVNGAPLRPGPPRTWREGVTFGPGAPVARLEGEVRIEPAGRSWRVAWKVPASAWIAAAVDGELGPGAPAEARRALAAVLGAWLAAHPGGNHSDGSLCPLTHCAVIRGPGSPEARESAAAAPRAEPGWIWFCASQGGVSLAPAAVWGRGPVDAPAGAAVPGDPWAAWTRSLTPAQVQALKRQVRPGLAPGQRGLRLGPSGPYPVEDLRLAAGRSFGWATWPSNACAAQLLPDGSLRLEGHGLGHNVGLCLATARHQAEAGMAAEEILRRAFVP